jgi:guanosine-3',5'-bis(diphosphate) 3'-pyrophosphohydrolase
VDFFEKNESIKLAMTEKMQTQDAQKIFQKIIKAIESYYPSFGKTEQNLITQAYEFAKKAHEGQKRKSGDPYITHTLEATLILISIKPDIETIMACLLHDVIGDTEESADGIEKHFGQEVRFLCEGVEKITKIRLQKNDAHLKYERFQKLFVAVAEDIRIIFIKLADRIHNLQTIQYLPPQKRERILKESFEIYAPVADKLGLFEFKTLIQDQYLKQQNPEMAQQIINEIDIFKKQKHSFFENAQKEIFNTFQKEKFSIQRLSGRQKSLYSVYEKMKRKNLTSALELYDILGFRIFVNNKDECYHALGILHSHFNPMPKRFKDYIAVPKANGYQSIHTTLLGIAGSHIPIEIQIRTEKMHEDAEYGPAAHWAYKKLQKSTFDEDYLKKTQWIPKEIEAEKKHDPEAFFQKISKSVLEEQIYVFTRSGEIKILPRESTPIDFAYSIHSEIGDSCIGARINKNIKPLNYTLKQGDIVEILTKKGRKPNPSWLDFVQTNTAKARIRSHINTLKREQAEESLKNEKEIEIGIENQQETKEEKEFIKNTHKKKIPKQYTLIIGGEKSISSRFAKCCNPEPGKSIIAYHSRGLGAVIHESECHEVEKLDPERLEEAYFVMQKKMEIIAKDRFGLMKDVSTIINDRHVFIWDSSVKRRPNNMVQTKFTVNVLSENDFWDLIKDLRSLMNVISVQEIKPIKIDKKPQNK